MTDFGPNGLAPHRGQGAVVDRWKEDRMIQGLVNMRRSDLVKWADKHQVADFPDGTRPKYEMDRAIEAAYVSGQLTAAALNDIRAFDPEPLEVPKAKPRARKGAGK